MEDEDIAPNTYTADPVSMGRQSCLYTMLEYCVLALLSTHTDWISCMYLAQYPRLPFGVLFCIHPFVLCIHPILKISLPRAEKKTFLPKSENIYIYPRLKIFLLQAENISTA